MNMFIPLFHSDSQEENVEGIIRSDSIAEVWLNEDIHEVTIRYRAPSDGRIIDHCEAYDSFTDAHVRYTQILRHIVDDHKNIRDINGEKIANELIRALKKGE